jgi:hypothetical protein
MSKLFKYSAAYIILNAMLVLWSYGSASAANEPVIPDAVRSAFLKLDFSDIVAECDQYFIDDPHFDGVWRTENICAEDLTPAERLMLSHIRSNSGELDIRAAYTALYAEKYREVHGTMPRDGVDLLVLTAPRYLSQAGWQEFSALPKEQQAKRACIGINPATGKIYDSFTKPGWSPLGMRIKKKRGVGSTKRMIVPVYHKETKSETPEMRDTQAWEISIFGEKKGRIILKFTTWQILDESGQSPKPVKGCGCAKK